MHNNHHKPNWLLAIMNMYRNISTYYICADIYIYISSYIDTSP